MGGGMTLILSGTNGLSDVDGTAATPAIRGTDANTGMFFPAADTIAFAEGGVEAMRLDAAGNVGIGTSSPSGKFVVAGSDAFPRELQVSTNDQTVTVRAKGKDSFSYNGTLNLSAAGAGGDVRFEINSTERARIDSSGNVGIGTSSPAAKLQVKVGTNQNFTVTSTSGVTQLQSINDAGNAFTQLDVAGSFITLSPGSTERARIDSSGNLLVGTTSTAGPGGARVVAGLFMTLAGSGGLNQAQSATLFTIPTDTAFLVTAQTGNANGLSTVVLVTLTSGGNSAVRTILMQDSGGFFISMSGANVQITNTLGGPIAYSFTAMRIF
jgi:hypothetical protein